ncbi:MAG: type II toxin-antitoxin system RelE/ParE family toxin [Spirochaetales bacterium]|jgi:putative addiction module killer protein|nr:type II toxin-antitoxin system RelE/ParE family toxin [Spirochaetales bacterium]
MKKLRRTGEFIRWLKNLRDSQARFRIYKRIDRLANGNPGDNRFLGDIAEMRIDYGPGYRVYYRDTGKEIIILLCGGDKTTQQADIKRARTLSAKYKSAEEE